MAEQTREEQYIKCSRCQMKYINNDDHIKKEFGYNRLNERYKTCIACRENRKQYRKSKAEELKTYKHKYWIDHKDDIKKKREQLMKDADESDGKIKYCNRCYQNKNIDQFVCPNGKIYNACYTCLDKRYNKNTIENILDSSSDEHVDNTWYVDSSDEEEVKKGGMKQLIKAINKIHMER